jgi:hypothetical protein
MMMMDSFANSLIRMLFIIRVVAHISIHYKAFGITKYVHTL